MALVDENSTDLERVEQLFAFLQGTVPEGTKIPVERVPHLTPDQAWTVIWYLGEEHWKVPDFVERCEACGGLFDSNQGGETREKPPYYLCDSCSPHYPEESEGE